MLNYDGTLERTKISLTKIDEGKQLKSIRSIGSFRLARQSDEGPPQIYVHFKVAILGLMSSNKMKILNRCVGNAAISALDKQKNKKAEQQSTMLGEYYNKFSSSLKGLTSSLTYVKRMKTEVDSRKKKAKSMQRKKGTTAIEKSKSAEFFTEPILQQSSPRKWKRPTKVKNDASGACMTSSDGIAIYMRNVQMKHVHAYFYFWTFTKNDESLLPVLNNETVFEEKEEDFLQDTVANKELSGKILRDVLKDTNAIAMVYDIKQIESFEYLHLMERLTRKMNVYRMLIRNGEDKNNIHVVQRDHDFLASNFDAHMNVCGGSGYNVAHCFNKLMADIIRKSKLLDVETEQDVIKLKGKKLEN